MIFDNLKIKIRKRRKKALNKKLILKINVYVYQQLSGIAGKIVEFPFDTVKVRLQTSTNDTFNGTFDCIVKTYKNEGFLGFYKVSSFLYIYIYLEYKS